VATLSPYGLAPARDGLIRCVDVIRGGRDAAGSRLVGIEGMRALAAGSVLVYHVWLYGGPDGQPVDLGPFTKVFDNLRAGVTLFFVLSGFLLFRPYAAAALRGLETPATAKYFRNRALRIAPAYWVILLAVAIVFEHALLRHPEQLVANAFLLQNYSQAYVFGAGIVPAWSLAIEVVFYLCVPLLGAMAIAAARRRGVGTAWAALTPVVLMVLIGWTAKAAGRIFDLHRLWDVSFPTHADWFAGGMALAVVRILWEDERVRLPRNWRPVAVGVAFALGATSCALYYKGVLTYVEYQTPIVVSCTLLLAVVVLADSDSRLLRVLSRRPIVIAGLASYSVFLWHDPLLRFLRGHGLTYPGAAGFLFNLALVGSLTAVLSALTYRLVEKPAQARKRLWQRSVPQEMQTERVDAELLSPPAPAATVPGGM